MIKRYFPNHPDGKLKQRDFLYLIEKLEKQSEANISLSTLKRFWKNEYTHTPQVYTLNALASLLDFPDWNTYKQAQHHNEKSKTPKTKTSPNLKKVTYIGIGLLLIIAVLALNQWPIQENKSIIEIPETVSFSVDKTVVKGVPSTVIFNYDLKEAQADSFFIQRSWNPANRTKVDPNSNFFSETYFYPGFHWASLIANDSVIRKERILIESEGWLASAKYNRLDPIPTYIDQKNTIKGGLLYVRPEDYEAVGFDYKKGMITSYHLVGDTLDQIGHDHFRLDIRMKMEAIDQIVCPFAEVRIIDEVDASWFTLVGKGCEGKLVWKVEDHMLFGDKQNLTTFGTQLKDWQTLSIISTESSTKIYLNEKEELSLATTDRRGTIKGLIITFNGLGMVDYVELKDLKSNRSYVNQFD